MKIIELIKKKYALQRDLDSVNEELESSYLAYHKKLIDAGFYTEFEVDGEPLDKFFYIRPYSLPEKDQGEGDYIRITFCIGSDGMDIDYECSYRREENLTIASIPFELLDSELETLKSALFDMNKEAKEKSRLNKIAYEAKQKKQQIANLKLQLKNLGEKI